MRQDVDHLQPILFGAARRNLVAEHCLFAEIVHEGRKDKFRRVGIANGPAGEAPRYRDDIGLRIATVYAKRVQLHHLAAIVLVQAVRLTTEWRKEERVWHSIH